MTKVHVLIHNGLVGGFADEIPASVSPAEEVRVSRILPNNGFLRVAFKLIRRFVNDRSGPAQWTREWECRWRVEILGERHAATFTSRPAAIEYEKRQIQQANVVSRFLRELPLTTAARVFEQHQIPQKNPPQDGFSGTH